MTQTLFTGTLNHNLNKNKHNFQWPSQCDEQPVLSQFVLKKGFVPDCVNSGRQWLLSEYADIDNVFNLFKAVYF